VVEQFGLDYDSLVEINPNVIMVRMPGFGLAGPWRDYVGWALNIEQLSGMSAATGYPDGPPCNLQGPADPIAGVHAGVALLAALEHRGRTGEGQLVEVAQIEVGAAVTAEPLIEYSMNGVIKGRAGNRQRNFVQGVYPTNAVDDWVALSVGNDAAWLALVAAMDRTDLQDDPRFSNAAARAANHDDFDAIVAGWTQLLSADDVVSALSANGIPAERVLTGDRMYQVPQLDARGYYQEIEHPITGALRYPGWPFHISPGPSRPHRCPSPTLGQHNAEVLGHLGITDEELNELRAQRVIGEKVLNL
jgi:crotonobetainyl-CoA:carnitine CoA-transferase CaiB-like acyl-CoA transferase